MCSDIWSSKCYTDPILPSAGSDGIYSYLTVFTFVDMTFYGKGPRQVENRKVSRSNLEFSFFLFVCFLFIILWHGNIFGLMWPFPPLQSFEAVSTYHFMFSVEVPIVYAKIVAIIKLTFLLII